MSTKSNASGVELLLFDREDDTRPAHVIALDPTINRTYRYWHVFVPGLQAGQLYGYRVHGEFDPGKGMRFDAAKVLLDPYGRGVVVPKQVQPLVQLIGRDAREWREIEEVSAAAA